MAPIQPEFDLFAELEASGSLSQTAPSSPKGQLSPTGQAAFEAASRKSLLMEQVMRDRRVLDEEDWCHVPSTDFFVDRIVENLKAIKEMTE